MFYSKIDINSKEWLDIIFAKRNKEYGAYQLRMYSTKASVLALGIVISFFFLLSIFFFWKRDMSSDTVIPVVNTPVIFEVDLMNDIITEENTKEDVVIPNSQSVEQQLAKDVSKLDVVKFTEINPSNSPVSDDIASVDKLLDKKVVLSNISLKGSPDGVLVPNGSFGKFKTNGGAEGVSVGNIDGTGADSKPLEIVEIMPTPQGGMAAFVKWVSENYKYSESAIQESVSGLVQVSFVVEKDGTLSTFEIKRDLGYGTGEEAIRLIKKAKKWHPGIQNGVPVRVAFTLPIRLSTITP